MAIKVSFAATLLVCVCLQLRYSKGAIACTSNDACHCMGDGVSISWENKFEYPLNFSYTNSDGTYSFTFSPCQDTPCGQTKNVAVCQYDPSANGNAGGYVSIGLRTDVTWDVTSANEFTVMYGGGDTTWNKKERKAVITVNVTDSGKSSFISTGEDDLEKEIDYNFKAVMNAHTPAPTGGGGGSVAGPIGIVIIFLMLAALVTYFVIGGIVMYTVKGARGVEVIPQYAFWKELPFLIKDGFMLTISPCTNKCGKQGGYSSL